MGGILTKTCFSPQSEPRIAKLCFSVVLKHLGGNSQKILFLVQKVTISEKSSEILRKFVLLIKFEKGQNLRNIWVCLNNCF